MLDSAPHALVNETVKLAGWAKPVVNAILRRALDEKSDLMSDWEKLEPPIRWSIPKFLWKRWKSEFGEEETIELGQWNNQPAEVFLRLNPFFPEATALPEEADAETVTGAPNFMRIRGKLPKSWLDRGWAYAQDPSTLTAVELLDPKPGETVLDACAAPGGKTLAMANRMENEGKISATDSSVRRLERLEANLKRLGVSNATLHQHDWLAESPADADNQFDAILLDVPCSNTGVIRRRIDVPWRLKRAHFDELAKTQLRLLTNVSRHLRPGGRLVYSTCSIDRQENEDVVQAFLAENSASGFECREERRILPWRDGFDGAYAALIVR